MTHPLLALALSVFNQVPDTMTFADAVTEAFIAQAQGRHAYLDSLIRDYSATVRTRIDVARGDRRRRPLAASTGKALSGG